MYENYFLFHIMQELPSEQAQDLAEYLKQHREDFACGNNDGWSEIYADKLAQIIQNYWDSLL